MSSDGAKSKNEAKTCHLLITKEEVVKCNTSVEDENSAANLLA